MSYILEKSPRAEKKWRVTTPTGKKVDFGATGYSDMTMHRSKERQILISTVMNLEKTGLNPV